MAEEDNINNATGSMKHLLLAEEELEVEDHRITGRPSVKKAVAAPASMGRTKLEYRKVRQYQHARVLPPDEAPAAADASMNLVWQGKMSYQEFWHSEHPTIFKNTCLEIVRRG